MNNVDIEIIKILFTGICSGVATWAFLKVVFEKFVNNQENKNKQYENNFDKLEIKLEKLQNQIESMDKENKVELHDLNQAVLNLSQRHDYLEKKTEEVNALLEKIDKNFTEIIKILKERRVIDKNE